MRFNSSGIIEGYPLTLVSAKAGRTEYYLSDLANTCALAVSLKGDKTAKKRGLII